jgi:hypothetical protein
MEWVFSFSQLLAYKISADMKIGDPDSLQSKLTRKSLKPKESPKRLRDSMVLASYGLVLVKQSL